MAQPLLDFKIGIHCEGDLIAALSRLLNYSTDQSLIIEISTVAGGHYLRIHRRNPSGWVGRLAMVAAIHMLERVWR